MTSNAEEHATPPAAATVQPPKATKRASVAPRKRPVAAGKPRSVRKATSADRRPKSQKAARKAKPTAGVQEGSKAAKVLSLLRRPNGRFTERPHESYRLVGAFCAWVSQRHGEQEDEAQARVREERERGAPLLRPKLDSHNPSKQRVARPRRLSLLVF